MLAFAAEIISSWWCVRGFLCQNGCLFGLLLQLFWKTFPWNWHIQQKIWTFKSKHNALVQKSGGWDPWASISGAAVPRRFHWVNKCVFEWFLNDNLKIPACKVWLHATKRKMKTSHGGEKLVQIYNTWMHTHLQTCNTIIGPIVISTAHIARSASCASFACVSARHFSISLRMLSRSSWM